MTEAGLRVSVVVPCRNESRHICGLLDAIRSQTLPPDEVVLADSSSDGTADVVAEYAAAHPGFTVRVVPFDRASIPGAVNLGIRSASGDLIVRLDGHSAPSPGYIERAVRLLADVTVGVAGGIWRVTAGADTAVARGIALAASHPMGAGDASYRVVDREAPPRDVDTVPFGCFRKSLWERLGGYNEALLSNEDYEFNYRVRQAGLRVVLDPAIASTYFARPTLGALATQYVRYGQWKMRMLKQYPQSLRVRQAIPPAFVAMLLVLAAASIFWPAVSLGLTALVGVYLLALALAGADACRRTGAWVAWPFVMAAFATIHLCWGGAALASLVSRGPTSPRAGRG